MKIIKAKNELTEGIEKIKSDDVFALKKYNGDNEKGTTELKLTRSKIRDISNFAHSINYIRTPIARTLVHNLPWNSSILHQNSERRVMKPEVIMPPREMNLVAEGTQVLLHCSEPNSYIVYTLDGSIPCFTNGVRYDPQRSPIIVPKDVLSFTIKFVGCKLKMVDSEIGVRSFSVSKDAPIHFTKVNQPISQAPAIRDSHHETVDALDLGLETPSSNRGTPQHPTGRLSSMHNLNYIPVGKIDDDAFSEDSNPI